MDMGFPAERTHFFQASIKLAQPFPAPELRTRILRTLKGFSDGVRVRFRVRFQAVKVPIFGGFPVESPTKKVNRLKALLRGISLSEYGSERFRVRLRRLSEYGSVAYLVERPTRETRAEQYSDTVLDFF